MSLTIIRERSSKELTGIKALQLRFVSLWIFALKILGKSTQVFGPLVAKVRRQRQPKL